MKNIYFSHTSLAPKIWKFRQNPKRINKKSTLIIVFTVLTYSLNRPAILWDLDLSSRITHDHNRLTLRICTTQINVHLGRLKNPHSMLPQFAFGVIRVLCSVPFCTWIKSLNQQIMGFTYSGYIATQTNNYVCMINNFETIMCVHNYYIPN